MENTHETERHAAEDEKLGKRKFERQTIHSVEQESDCRIPTDCSAEFVFKMMEKVDK